MNGLLVIELQNDLCHPSLAGGRGVRAALARAVADRNVLANLRPVLDAFRSNGDPVIYCNKERAPGAHQPDFPPIMRSGGADPILISGTPGAAVVEQVAPAPGDTVLRRLTGIDPSADPALWETCERLGVGSLVVAGISTTFAVEGTVRAAANRGYAVTVLEDCCAGVPAEWHRFSMDNVMPLLGEVATAEALLERIAGGP